MNASNTKLAIENQCEKVLFQRLFLIGNQLEKLNKVKFENCSEVNDIIWEIDDMMEVLLRTCYSPIE